jgi:type 1 fimbria pilin
MMIRQMGRIGAAAGRLAAALGGVVLGGVVSTASAGSAAWAATVGGNKIEPHQWFAGLVNGKFDNAIVTVACPIGAKTGRALSGQTLEVTMPQVIATNFGNTGSKGRRIASLIGPSVSTSTTIVFKAYNRTVPFPTNIPVPCGGTGTVLFVPIPGSKTSAPATVTVTYGNVTAN